MASELIDSIYDVTAILKEIKTIESELEGLKNTISTYSADLKKLYESARGAKSQEDLSKASKDLNENMVKGQKVMTEYGEAQKQLDSLATKLIQTRAKSIVASSNEQKEIDKLNKTIKEENEITRLNTIINDKNSGSIEKAEASNKLLQIQKRKLIETDKDYKKKLDEINAAQDKNNELLKNSSNKLQEQKIGIGNYKETFTNLLTQFKNGEIGLKGLTTGFFQMAKATLAALWPVGLVAAALGLLYAVFKNFAPLLDKIEQGFAALTAAWGVLKNSLGQFISGNQSLKESMSGVGKSMADAARDAANLKKAEQELEDATGGLEVANKKLETQMQQLLLQSKNKTLSEKERMALIDQAIALENQQFENEKKISDETTRIAYENIRVKNKLTEEQYAKLKELGVDYAEELKDQGVQISDADISRLKDALLKNEDIEQKKIAIVEKAMNRKDALEEKAAANAEKAAEKAAQAAEKRAAEEEKRNQEILAASRRLTDSKLALMEEGEAKQIALSDEAFKRTKEDLEKNNQLTSELEIALDLAHGNEIQKIQDDFRKQKAEKDQADLDKYIADFEKNMQKEVDALSAGYKDKEQELKREYSKGKLSKEEYEKALIDIQTDAAKEANDKMIGFLQKELETANISADKKAELSTKIKDLQIANENAVLDATIEANEKKTESDKKRFSDILAITEQIASAGMELYSAIGDFQKQQSENRLAELEKEQTASDEYFTKRQENLDKAIMSDAVREQAQKEITEAKAKRDKEILDKKRAEEIRAAKWEKAQALVSAGINTALAVIKALVDPGGVLGTVYAVAAGLTGAATIATIISKQIPAYATGSDNTPEGWGIYGEVRPEIRETKRGELFYAEKPTMTYFNAGDKVYKSVEEFEKNKTATNQPSFEFDYKKFGEQMPQTTINLDSGGLWGIVNKQNDRAVMINRRYKIGN